MEKYKILRGKMSERPIDALDRAKGKKVMIKLKNGEEVIGILRALDLHLNLWLDEAEINKQNSTVKVGTILIRGDTIVYATPVTV
jgi:small nuclear ribonucleoprotein